MDDHEFRRQYYGYYPDYYEGDEEPLTHQETCSHCNGKGVVTEEVITLRTICKHCKGRGSVDWIDHMTGNPSIYNASRSLQFNIAAGNVERLIVLMKQIMASVGEDIRVSVSLRSISSLNSLGQSRRSREQKWIEY